MDNQEEITYERNMDMIYCEPKWRDVIGYEGLYKISNEGEVYSLVSKKILKSFPHYEKGYIRHCLYKNKSKKTLSTHRLVAFAFIPNLENKPEVNHINGIKSDNRVENLEWVTASENCIHSFKIGLNTPKVGENNNKSKLTKEDVSKVYSLNRDGMSTKDISNMYNVCRTTIDRILSGKRWNHVYKNTDRICSNSKIVLNIETGVFHSSIREVCSAYKLKIGAGYLGEMLSGKAFNRTNFILI